MPKSLQGNSHLSLSPSGARRLPRCTPSPPVNADRSIELKNLMLLCRGVVDGRSRSKRVDWSNLPKELWLEISKHVKSAIDIVRFRSICRLWRSLLPIPSSYTHRIPHHGCHCLLQTKTYRLEPLHHSSSSKGKGWIIKFIGESKLRLLNPFLPKFTLKKPEKLVLNMMDFRVVELFEDYSFNHQGENYDAGGINYRQKVVLFESRIVFVLYTNGTLYVSEIGDKNWTAMNHGNDIYDDIIIHKGNVYVVDRKGTLWWIKINRLSLFFEFVRFSPMMYNRLQKKHLVESDGSLYVVDITWRTPYTDVYNYVKVFKLDVERCRWLPVKNLGDYVFVLGRDSNFSLSARDYYGLQRNCIYFFNEVKVCAFNLHKCKAKRSPQIFWPSQSLFTMQEEMERD